jgi:hypothetical protein
MVTSLRCHVLQNEIYHRDTEFTEKIELEETEVTEIVTRTGFKTSTF